MAESELGNLLLHRDHTRLLAVDIIDACEARDSFQRRLADVGIQFERLTVPQEPAALFTFYRNQGIEDCRADANGNICGRRLTLRVGQPGCRRSRGLYSRNESSCIYGLT